MLNQGLLIVEQGLLVVEPGLSSMSDDKVQNSLLPVMFMWVVLLSQVDGYTRFCTTIRFPCIFMANAMHGFSKILGRSLSHLLNDSTAATMTSISDCSLVYRQRVFLTPHFILSFPLDT